MIQIKLNIENTQESVVLFLRIITIQNIEKQILLITANLLEE